MIKDKVKLFSRKWWEIVDRDIISKLPKIPITKADGAIQVVNSRVKGSTILDKNKDAKDSKGEPISPSTYYIVPTEALMMNHKKEIEKRFKKGGWKEVKVYVDHLHAIITEKRKRALDKITKKETLNNEIPELDETLESNSPNI